MSKEEIEKMLKEYFAEISRNLVEALVRAKETGELGEDYKGGRGG